MDAPRLPEGITMASLISSAWALVLAHITGEQDIVFGHLVAGRNSDIPEVAEIVGPCLNVIPVRTLVYPIKTSKISFNLSKTNTSPSGNQTRWAGTRSSKTVPIGLLERCMTH
ncbi:hypothetical protein P3342_007465 [Pyrenophora teres f. teres]|nr:hypothetical protein P3342_007465 [Pyrenophora teres f. teres]